MAPALARAQALLSGTDAMRQAGVEFLPKFPGEAPEVYQWRLKVAVLNNFYAAMLDQMVGMMFAKPVQLEKCKLPEAVIANIDKRGGTLDTFAADLCRALISKGRPHILIDHPKKPDEAQTVADDEKLGLRPYWVLMEPGCVISAYADTESGAEKLQHFRWREFGSARDGAYGFKSVERIRLLDSAAGVVTFEKWERERSSDQFTMAEHGECKTGGVASKALTEIPVVTLYSDRQAFMVAKPTLDDIAHKNIEHWQSSADQRHILTVSRFPILFQIGTKQPVALVGPYSMFHTDASIKEAMIGYAEAEGKGTEHGWKDMDRIVAEAEAMMVRIMISDGAKSDSGEKIDYSKEGSKLQRLAVELQRGVQQALVHTARWMGMDDAAAGIVTLHKEFGLSSDDAKAIDQLLELRATGDLTRKTLWQELTERALFRTSFKPETEEAALEDEAERKLEKQLLLAPPPAPGAGDDDEEEVDADGNPKKKPAVKAAA